jgi:uncharacterized protein (DUF362 family)
MIDNEISASFVYASKLSKGIDIQKCLRESTSFWPKKLNNKSRVLIKPNLCAIKSHETGTTTDPKVVEEIVIFMKKEFGISDISVIESDGSQVLADLAFELLGYRELAERLDVKLVNLSKVPFSIKTFPENAFVKEIKFPITFTESDFLISVPKIKTHSDCFMTCALKNQYGCNPYWRKTSYHKQLDDAIVDFANAFMPDMTIVDGVIAMDGRKGPTDGVPLRMDTIIIGNDPVAVDHFVSTLMEINPMTVRYIVEAEKRGLGTTKYKTLGTPPGALKIRFNIKPARWHNLYGILQNY